MIYYNRKLKNVARTLRKNMTDSERLMWSRLRRKQLKGLQFYRQKVIGDYVVDFYCASAKLVIEIDGSQHFEPPKKREDAERDKYLARVGLLVLRFTSWDVIKNPDSAIDEIWQHL